MNNSFKIFLVVAALCFASILGIVYLNEPCCDLNSAHTQIRELIVYTAEYSHENKIFPDDISVVLSYSKYEARHLRELISNPNFEYIKPAVSPQDASPKLVLMKFRKGNDAWVGFHDGHVEWVNPNDATSRTEQCR